MYREKIISLIQQLVHDGDGEGLTETGIAGVRVFEVTEAVRCAPAIYEPCIVAIVNGKKEAILNGEKHEYDQKHYLCCSMSIPVEAGAPAASSAVPLMGVYISLDTKVMTQLTIELENASTASHKPDAGILPPALSLASWDDDFSEALLRLLQLTHNPADVAVLGESRLRELYYTVLKGEAGQAMCGAFAVGNEIATAIDFLSSNLTSTVSIEDIASKVGMSRAVLHRKFKQATSMSPIQFAKSMRLNTAAVSIAQGKTINQAAYDVGYVSSSQFSREFKRLFGQSPGRWQSNHPDTLSPP